MKKTFQFSSVAAMAGLVAACSGSPQTPLSPSAAAGATTTAAADGSTLKVSAPVPVSPVDGTRVDSRRPVLVWQNAASTFATDGALSYQIEGTGPDGFVYSAEIAETSGLSEHALPVDLAYDASYTWRVRARLDGTAGPWSSTVSFLTLAQPGVTVTFAGGTVGPTRSIGFDEAYGIILRIHNEGRFDLGRNSSRDQRVAFLFGAVAAIHYGHPRWNPEGGDPGWCVKDAGGGRPPSDDVLVACGSREAWDLIASAGANGYSFHRDYLGRLPGNQNVYPPGIGALNALPR